MNKLLIILFVFSLGFTSCEDLDPITPADLIDSNFDSPANYDLSATVEIFPFRSNKVRFYRRSDSKYKIESQDVDGQIIGVVFKNLAVGKYTISDDESLLLRYTDSEKVKYDSNSSTVASNMVLTITEVDSTGTIVSGAFEAKVYEIGSNSPGDPSNQRNIYTGVFRDLLLQ